MRLLASTLAATMLCSAANAADLPSRKDAPVPFVAPALFDWSGIYVGVNGGYTWGSSATTMGISSATLAAVPPIIPTVNAAGTQSFQTSGGTVGGQVGYNQQLNSFAVIGVEGDMNWSGLRGSIYSSNAIPVIGGAFGVLQTVRTDWQATLRGRIGLLPMDHVMVYATAGLALAGLRYTSSFSDTFAETETGVANKTRAGWTVGGGIEYAITPNWSAKVEYLHAQYPTTSATGYSVLTDGSIATAQHSTTFKTDTVRGGVNYRFSWADVAPVMARY